MIDLSNVFISDKGGSDYFVTRYYLQRGEGEKVEVSKQAFINAERAAGFFPKSGDGIATGGFSQDRGDGHSIVGTIEYL